MIARLFAAAVIVASAVPVFAQSQTPQPPPAPQTSQDPDKPQTFEEVVVVTASRTEVSS
jgi:hypothetical protein